MLRNNHFLMLEIKIKKNVFGEARALSGSFEIKLLAPLVFSQSARAEMKKSAISRLDIAGFLGYRYKPFKARRSLFFSDF